MSIVCLSRLFFSDLGIASGKVDVAITVTIDQEMRKLDDARFGWGINLDRACGQRHAKLFNRVSR